MTDGSQRRTPYLDRLRWLHSLLDRGVEPEDVDIDSLYELGGRAAEGDIAKVSYRRGLLREELREAVAVDDAERSRKLATDRVSGVYAAGFLGYAHVDRGEADAALIVASDPMYNFSQPAREHLARIPYVALDPKETPTVRGAAVSFTTATYGINTAGTVYRMDDVPIPLRPAFESPYWSDYDVLKGIERRLRERQLG